LDFCDDFWANLTDNHNSFYCQKVKQSQTDRKVKAILWFLALQDIKFIFLTYVLIVQDYHAATIFTISTVCYRSVGKVVFQMGRTASGSAGLNGGWDQFKVRIKKNIKY
jgi:hypothetical protein